MKKGAPEISQKHLKSLLSYNRVTGAFYWKVDSATVKTKGKIAGWVDHSTGYRKIGIHTYRYFAHRLAVLYVSGKMPPEDVDHINGIKHARNTAHRVSLAKNNTSGYRGVSLKRKNKWIAQIKVDGKHMHLGHWDTPELAAIAYNKAAKKILGKFTFLNKVGIDHNKQQKMGGGLK